MIFNAEDVLLDTAKHILVDSNILITYFDKKHQFHIDTYNRLSPMYLKGANFYYVQPCLLEFKEYWRRKLITECIELQLSLDFHFYNKFKTAYIDFRTQNLKRNHLYLSDRQLKDLRLTLENVAAGKGLLHWFQLCAIALQGNLSKIETQLSSSSFIYSHFNDNFLFPSSNKLKWPKWPDADLIQEKFGLASNDAAILNMVNGAVGIDSFMSNDGDMLFAAANGALNANVNTYTFIDTSNYI